MDHNFQQQLVTAKRIFGQRLKDLRYKLSDTQTEFKDRLPEGLKAGTKSHISKWENGDNLPSGTQLLGLHNAFNISIDYLLGISDQPAPNKATQNETADVLPTDPLFNYLWTEEYTEQVEKSAAQLWVATHNLFWNYESLKWHKIILENVTERHIKSYYLYKKTIDNDKVVNSLVDELQVDMGDDWRTDAHFVGSTADEFPSWAETILYKFKAENPRCIMVLPHGYGLQAISGYNLELSIPMRDAFAAWFQTVWNKNLGADNADWIIQ